MKGVPLRIDRVRGCVGRPSRVRRRWAQSRETVTHPRPASIAVAVRHARRHSGHRLERRRRLDSPRAARGRSLAAVDSFVVGFDVKAYLESFTSGRTTLRPRTSRRLQGPRRFRGEGIEREADSDRRVGGRRAVGAGGHRSGARRRDRRRDRPRPAGSQRAGLALAGLADLPDARRARTSRRSASRRSSIAWRRCRSRRSTRRSDEFVPLVGSRSSVLDARAASRSGCGSSSVEPSVQRQPGGVRSAPARGDRRGCTHDGAAAESEPCPNGCDAALPAIVGLVAVPRRARGAARRAADGHAGTS